MVLYLKYGISVDGIEDMGGSHIPIALTFDVWYDKAKELEAENGMEYMKEKAHGMWLLLQMERGVR